MKSVINIPVRGYHIDHFGHVNHGRYIEFLEEARWHYLDANELIAPIHEFGAIHVVARIDIQYLAPARAGDLLRVETQVVSRFDKGFVMHQDVFLKDGCVRGVEARVTNVFIDTNGRAQSVKNRILDAWPDLKSATDIGNRPVQQK